MSHAIVQKIWNLANVLRDDGVSYGDYLEQITYLLFLKMAHEINEMNEALGQSERNLRFPHLRNAAGAEDPTAERADWAHLRSKRGDELETFYVRLLRTLSTEPGMLGQIFTKSQNKIQDPAKLARVVGLIDREAWSGMDADVKGDIYEGLLQKNAEDTKSGAGQYFTPRPLIRAMVTCVQPQPNRTIADPACGTGGFFLAAQEWITENHTLDRAEKEFLKNDTFHGNEIVANTRRLCLMNLYLHGIGRLDGEPHIRAVDALVTAPARTYDYVLANPPFGKKSSMTSTNAEGETNREELRYERQDFWESTSNKQLNFLQHIKSMLALHGEAAVVLPDNVLFEGGAGERIRRRLLQTTELHTIFRLPTGIFYAQGVKANVLFFRNRSASKEAHTRDVWYYDYRTNVHHTLKRKPMTDAHLEEFVRCYRPGERHARTETWSTDNPDGRWRKYTREELLARDKASLDLFWLRDDSLTDLDNLPAPDELAASIVEDLESALAGFREIMGEVGEA